MDADLLEVIKKRPASLSIINLGGFPQAQSMEAVGPEEAKVVPLLAAELSNV